MRKLEVAEWSFENVPFGALATCVICHKVSSPSGFVVVFFIYQLFFFFHFTIETFEKVSWRTDRYIFGFDNFPLYNPPLVSVLYCIQLFWGRLSYKSVKAHATMSKGIMGNADHGCLIEAKCISLWQSETAQTGVLNMLFLPETLLASGKELQTSTTDNTNQHCYVRFYAWMGQPFMSKLLYNLRSHHSTCTLTTWILYRKNKTQVA